MDTCTCSNRIALQCKHIRISHLAPLPLKNPGSTPARTYHKMNVKITTIPSLAILSILNSLQKNTIFFHSYFISNMQLVSFAFSLVASITWSFSGQSTTTLTLNIETTIYYTASIEKMDPRKQITKKMV